MSPVHALALDIIFELFYYDLKLRCMLYFVDISVRTCSINVVAVLVVDVPAICASLC